MIKFGALVVCVMMAVGGSAMADGAAPPPMPTPAKDLDAVKPLIKSWSCTSKNTTGDKMTGKLVYKKELDGFWVSFRFDQAKTKAMPALSGYAMFGIDPIKKDWVMEGYDSFGGTLHVRSKDGMAWTGTSVDNGKETPATVTLAYDAKTKHHAWGATINGQVAFDYDCK